MSFTLVIFAKTTTTVNKMNFSISTILCIIAASCPMIFARDGSITKDKIKNFNDIKIEKTVIGQENKINEAGLTDITIESAKAMNEKEKKEIEDWLFGPSEDELQRVTFNHGPDSDDDTDHELIDKGYVRKGAHYVKYDGDSDDDTDQELISKGYVRKGAYYVRHGIDSDDDDSDGSSSDDGNHHSSGSYSSGEIVRNVFENL